MKEYRGKIPFLLKEIGGKILYLCSSNRNIEDYYNVLSDIYSGNILKLENTQSKDELEKDNYDLLEILKSEEDFIILLSLEAILREYFLEGKRYEIEIGKSLDIKELENSLEESGYNKEYMVEERNQYSMRGDILDIFPKNSKYPVRIEFSFNNEVERIAYFDIETQKSVEKKNQVYMYINNNIEEKNSFLDFLNNRNDLKIFIENIDLLNYKLEEAIVRERDKEQQIRELYEKIERVSKKIDVIKSEGDTERVKSLNKKDGIKYENISQIREGDYIIHENYGVGIYLGIQEIDGKDYLAIRYADEDRLFVPIEGLNKIERFLVSTGKTPELYNLGRRGFKRRREKLEEDMLKFAKEIVEIQARRALRTGYKFSPDTVWQEEFEEKFPYIETRDQKNAIKDVKRDMESSKVMDRIVCGDVGYGKTEVAIRAAFKCVMDGKQVLIVAPTTVLAQQHYDRFVERYEDYPITLELLSRLSGDKEQKEIIKKVENGSVDIVIGTHRVLSGDLKFKNLGLIIVDDTTVLEKVDEEQKFGVKDKEKLKKMKNNVDMLTLTATPIPRTLNYALLGIRDISVIETAPEGRVPVETSFINDNKKDIRESIMKEIAREGQVFYIFNRVKRIEDKLNDLKKILPKFVTIDYIHGKMTPKNIKEKLKKFQDGDIDILLSTTIIENGIDIENANTILIEGIDKLGLSQVYQLRGRVGRGKRKGYCYLIVDKEKKLGKKASERKETLKDIGEFGGGFKLSLEDMRIRGAGEILGDKQHGALETFGYNLYTKLLQEEIAKVKGDYKEDFETKIILKEDSYIPRDYIEGDERLIIYRRLVDTRDLEKLSEIKAELIDRFGELPKEVVSLLRYLEIKILAKDLKIEEIVEKDEEYFLKFNDYVNFEKLMKLIEEKKARYSQKEGGLYYFEDILKFLYWYKGDDDLNEKV